MQNLQGFNEDSFGTALAIGRRTVALFSLGEVCVQTWLFGIPFALGVLLVVCSALGAAELDDMVEADGAGPADDQGLLAWLGLGRVPAIIVVTFLLLIFGGVGLLLCTPLSA